MRRFVLGSLAAIVLAGVGSSIRANTTLLYSYENNVTAGGQTGPDGWYEVGTRATISQSSVGATVGSSSLQFSLSPLNSSFTFQSQYFPSGSYTTSTTGYTVDLTLPAPSQTLTTTSGATATLSLNLNGNDAFGNDSITLATANIDLAPGTYSISFPIAATYHSPIDGSVVSLADLVSSGAFTPTNFSMTEKKTANVGTDPFTIYLDNFQAVSTPEPASLSLLGLSGAILVIRRKK